MWLFDGDEWTEEGAPQEKKAPQTMLRIEEFVPELQVLEVVPVPRTNPVRPFSCRKASIRFRNRAARHRAAFCFFIRSCSAPETPS